MSTDAVAPPPPQGAYQPAVHHRGVIYTAGMTPRRDGALLVTGVVGESVTLDDALPSGAPVEVELVAAVLDD